MKHTFTTVTTISLCIFLSACLSSRTVQVARPSENTQPAVDITTFSNPVSRNESVADPHHGKESGFALTAMAGVNGKLANGVAIAHYFEDKGTIVSIQLNIAAAKDGEFYAGWLQGQDDEDVVGLGQLTSSTGNVQHNVRFDTDKDLEAHKNVVVTLQKDGNGAAFGEVVATGILKQTKR